MNPDTEAKSFDVFRTALSGSDDLIFEKKLLGGLFEGLAALEFTRTILAFESKIPVLGEVFCKSEAFLLRGNAPVLLSKKSWVPLFF
jgi:hypothetical protein